MSWASLDEAMHYGYGIERAFCCHVHGDTNPSASVNSATGLWFCYACGARGKYNFSEIPYGEAASQIIKYLDHEQQAVRHYPEEYLDLYDSMGPGDYWLSRFTRETASAHRLGHMEGRYATIPFRDEAGGVLGVIRRDLTGQDPAKYRYPTGVTVSQYMYNGHRLHGDYVLLTEGATDAIAAEEAGWSDAAATYRNGVSHAQVMMLRRHEPKVVIVAYDQDSAGEKGYRQALHALSTFTRVDRLTWDTHKDLASMPLEERTRMFQELRSAYYQS